MADLGPTQHTPDNYVQNNLKPQTQVEYNFPEYPKLSHEVGGAVFHIKNGVATIIIKGETQKETKELNKEILRKIQVQLTPEEIEAIGGEIFAFFRGNILVKYEIGDNKMIDVENLDINNEFGNLLTKKIKGSYFERKENGEIIIYMRNGDIFNQNDNDFHKIFYMDFHRLKKTIKK